MKKILLLVIIATIALSSCKQKYDDPKPTSGNVGTDTAVTIEGTVYPVVQIGSQSWTAENYRGPGGIFNTGVQQSVLNGKLYTPQEAMQITLPTGWHIPTYDDYLTLLVYRGAVKNSDGSYSLGINVAHSLMSETGWSEGGGNNYSKFNALPSGFYHLEHFFGSGNGASFLHSSTLGYPPDKGFLIGPGPDGQPLIFLGLSLLDGDSCSIRFVKNN
jgi:uncharacterized protein (TIGR02145 family)